MWSGNQRPTSAASAGCVTAMPAPMTAVAARRPIASGAAARSPLPTAVNANPVMTARVTPSRATSREPTNAAAANRMIGRPVSIPISVPERWNRCAVPESPAGPRAAASAARYRQARGEKRRQGKSGFRQGISLFEIFCAGSRGPIHAVFVPSAVEAARRCRGMRVTPRLRAASARRRASPCAPALPRASRVRPRPRPRARA